MTQKEGEQRIRSLQKQFLSWVETHPQLRTLEPEVFNEVRHRVFRSTFFAYRLGVVGVDAPPPGLYKHFFGWLDSYPEIHLLGAEATLEVAEQCFVTSLRAFWVGVVVNAYREQEAV